MILPHCPRRTGIHFVGKCSRRSPRPDLIGPPGGSDVRRDRSAEDRSAEDRSAEDGGSRGASVGVGPVVARTRTFPAPPRRRIASMQDGPLLLSLLHAALMVSSMMLTWQVSLLRTPKSK
ncbi:hypothetical protein M446_6426 [Methylobacterium sp. 4-46]|nr:hypothetical protein M446_6426 [Methylobacterium sp. 4-46]